MKNDTSTDKSFTAAQNQSVIELQLYGINKQQAKKHRGGLKWKLTI